MSQSYGSIFLESMILTHREAKAVALAAGGDTGKNNKALESEIDKGKE